MEKARGGAQWRCVRPLVFHAKRQELLLPQFPWAAAESAGSGPAGEFAPLGEGVAGNGASLAPATSNPRLACEDNGCLIFSIRRAQCRILSFTRGGASEVISQRHSARTLLQCGGARTPASAGISRGPGCAAAATSKGPSGPGRLWEPEPPPLGAAQPAGPRAAAGGTLRSSPARPPLRSPLSWGLLGPEFRRSLSGAPLPPPAPVTLPLSSGPQVLFSFESRESKGKQGKEGEGRGGWELDTKR